MTRQRTNIWASLIPISMAIILIMTGLVNAAGSQNLPWDEGNGDPADNDEFENNHSIEPEGGEANMIVDDNLTYTAENSSSTFTINENLTINSGKTLTFDGITITMNGSADGVTAVTVTITGNLILINSTFDANGFDTSIAGSLQLFNSTYDAGGGTVSVAGFLIAINSTVDMDTGNLYVSGAGYVIYDNSSLLQAGTFMINDGETAAYGLACNSYLEADLLSIGSVMGPVGGTLWTVNTDYDFTLVGIYDDGIWKHGYQHYVYLPATDADAANRTIEIADHAGNDTQWDWSSKTLNLVDLIDYLHMDDHEDDGVLTFGAIYFLGEESEVAGVPTYTYEIDYGGNGTVGVNVTVDYPSTWRDSSVEAYGHTTESNVRYRGMSAELPFFESPYGDGPATPLTGRDQFDEYTRNPLLDTMTVGVAPTRSVEINYANIVAYAGLDQSAELGSIVTLTGTATCAERSTALTYSWVVYNSAMTAPIVTLSGRTARLNITSTYFTVNTTYYVVLTVVNGNGSYATDTMALRIVPADSRGTGGSQTGGEDEDNASSWSWRDWDSWKFWRSSVRHQMWLEIKDFFNTYVWRWEFWLIIVCAAVVLYFIWPAYQRRVLRMKRWVWK